MPRPATHQYRFLDNSAGVNTSDVEVNLKILLDAPIQAGAAQPAKSAARQCHRRSRRAGIAQQLPAERGVEPDERRAIEDLGEHQQLLRWLERHGEIDRAVEFLPTDEEMEATAPGRGLTRPELAVLFAYGKIALNHALTETGSAADPYLARELERYFPRRCDGVFPNASSVTAGQADHHHRNDQ